LGLDQNQREPRCFGVSHRVFDQLEAGSDASRDALAFSQYNFPAPDRFWASKKAAASWVIVSEPGISAVDFSCIFALMMPISRQPLR
jgi:hypothetical protein